MGLPWFRVDTDFYHHDKILYLKAQRGGFKAIAVYLSGIGWAVSHGTDGHIPAHVAPAIDADKTTIGLLTAARLWEPNGNGWHIRNFAQRQELEVISEAKRAAAKAASAKANCVRWHGPDCHCWQK